MNITFDNVNFTGPILFFFGCVLILLAVFSYIVIAVEYLLKLDIKHDTRLARMFLIVGFCILVLGALVGWLFPNYL